MIAMFRNVWSADSCAGQVVRHGYVGPMESDVSDVRSIDGARANGRWPKRPNSSFHTSACLHLLGPFAYLLWTGNVGRDGNCVVRSNTDVMHLAYYVADGATVVRESDANPFHGVVPRIPPIPDMLQIRMASGVSMSLLRLTRMRLCNNEHGTDGHADVEVIVIASVLVENIFSA